MLKTIIQSFFTKGLVAIASFAILIISSKYLGISTRGEISVIILNLAIIQMINEIYTGYSLVHFVAKYNPAKIFLKGLGFTLLITSLSNIVLYVLGIQPPGYGWMLYFLSVIMILNTFNCVLILAKEYYRMYNFLSVLQPALLLAGIFIYLGLFKEYTLSAYLVPLVLSFVIAFIISFWFVVNRMVLTKVSNTSFKWTPILRNGLFCQLAVLMHVLSGKLCYYLLDTKPDVGLFSTSTSLIESVLIITNAITPILLSKVANASVSTPLPRFTLIFAKLCFLFSILAVLVLYFIPEELFIYLLGKSFSASKNIMLALSPGIIFLSFSGIISHYFSGIGNLKIVSFYNFFGFITSLVLALLLIGPMGITGAVIATNVSYFITFVLSLIIFMKKNNMKLADLVSGKSDWVELKKIFSGK